MINLVFLQIVIVLYKFLSKILKLVIIFYLKLLKINLNIVLKTIIFDIYGYILIEYLYCIFIEYIIVNCFNFYIVFKEDFFISFKVVQMCIQTIKSLVLLITISKKYLISITKLINIVLSLYSYTWYMAILV